MIKDFYGKYQPIINYYKIKLKEVYLFKHIYRDNDEKKTDISNDLNKDYDDDDDDAKSVSSYTSINSFSSLKTDFSDYNLLNTYSNEYLQNISNQKIKRLIILKNYKVNFILYRSDNSIVEEFRLRINNIFGGWDISLAGILVNRTGFQGFLVGSMILCQS